MRHHTRVRDAIGDGVALASIWMENALYYVQRFLDDFQVPREDGLAEWFEEGLKQEQGADSHRTLVAEVSGKVVGFASGRVEPPLDDASRQMLPHLGVPTLRIDALGVAEPQWRHGIGPALVRALEGWGRSHGARFVITHTYRASPVSVPFWERGVGYAPRGLIFQRRIDDREKEMRG